MFGFQNVESEHQPLPAEDLMSAHNATDQFPFECPYPDCGHSFKYKFNLNAHQRKKHGGLYGSDQLVAFFCRISNCGRTFCTRNALAKHQRCIHGTYWIHWAWLNSCWDWRWLSEVTRLYFKSNRKFCRALKLPSTWFVLMYGKMTIKMWGHSSVMSTQFFTLPVSSGDRLCNGVLSVHLSALSTDSQQEATMCSCFAEARALAADIDWYLPLGP